MKVHLIYFAHGVVTHVVIKDSELEVDRDVACRVQSVWAGLDEVEADDDRVVKADSALAVPASHGQVPGRLQAGGRDREWLRVEAGAVWLHLNMT